MTLSKENKQNTTSIDRSSTSTDSGVGKFPALTTFQIKVHTKLLEQETIKICSRPQDFIHGVETVYVPGRNTKGRRFLWRALAETLDGQPIILGQVQNVCDDTSTLIVIKATNEQVENENGIKDSKEYPRIQKISTLKTSTTGSLTYHLSSENYPTDRIKPKKNAGGHVRRLCEYASKVIGKTIRTRRKEEWMASMRVPRNNSNKMEMVFFD